MNLSDSISYDARGIDDQNEKVQELKNTIKKLRCKERDTAEKIVKLNEKSLEYECKLKEKDDKIAKLESLIKLKEKKGIRIERLPGLEDFEAAFEDLPFAGPEWMVIQRRIDGTVSFNSFTFMHSFWLPNGLGNHEGEFWLGCGTLHKLTSSRRYELYIELVDFDNHTGFARYDNFVVGSENVDYALKSLGAYPGSAGDAMSGSVNEKFKHCERHYADLKKVWPWWAKSQCNLNGVYHSYKTDLADKSGIWWGKSNMGKRCFLKTCKMLIRPYLTI
ncbi:fibrinogen-like protein 1 isoform X2 [Drosophila subpulchrella]|uniref:fibrinogen-like protein 1 isoform X2 n=1 Tax=Drosophila subpulchrella TaxID=1486046 RepID=UPI0018A164A1|nr:fibrinogen-like protein 1 isoform X2 [Drosophila subpulchrella]